MVRRALLFLVPAAWAVAEIPRETALGLLLAPGGARLIRANTQSEIGAKAGDVLYAGDALRTAAAPASFLYCPGRTSQRLEPSGEVLIDARQLKVKSGSLGDQKPVGSCFLPTTLRVSVASQQHYGVSMVRGVTDPKDPALVPQDQWPAGAAAEIGPLDKAIAVDPNDAASVVARAALFEKHNLKPNALADYRKLAGVWKDAVWVRSKIFELLEAIHEASAKAAAIAPTGGQTYALMVGVSKYQRLPQEQWLQYAHADAEQFEQHVRSPRGGGVPPENILTLTDEKATTARLRNAFQTFLKARATKNDTVIVMIAGHGVVEVPGSKGAYILTHDADVQDLAQTALPMVEVQELIQNELSKVGRVMLFVDVCRAGSIGSLKGNPINNTVEKLGEVQGEILGLMASRSYESSVEGPQFGGGHGAFTYFLLKALSGAADEDGDGIVNVGEVIFYVPIEVRKATQRKQYPRDFGNMNGAVPLSYVKKPGIQLTRATFPLIFDPNGAPLYLAAAQAQPATLASETVRLLERYHNAIDSGRLLPDAPGSAFEPLRELRSRMDPEQFRLEQNRLRVTLEDRGQQVLLRYLTGDQIPQTRQDFAEGAAYYSAARVLTPESLFLEGRESFCRGRELLFDKTPQRFAESADRLEHAVRIDPNGAPAFNALGIAYLEQADYPRAIAALRDATRRAPHWAY
ncbi:MAG: hypothetical protein ACRD8O_11795, partial [Bryobacteraceae bacterium]